MTNTRLLGSLAVLVIAIGIGGILTSMIIENNLLTGSEWAVPAAATLGMFGAAVALFTAVGRPWRSWKRTPYW